jgi:hypothetical protein
MPPRTVVSARSIIVLTVLPFLVAGFRPRPAQGQLGAIEVLARRVSDLSFYFGVGDLFPHTGEVTSGDFAMASFGMELLFEVGSVEERIESSRPPPTDTAALTWTEMVVVRSGGKADTTYVYEVRPVRRAVPMRTIWLFELGLGYGQVVGFESTESDLDLRGSVRDLPSVSLYASYDPIGVYFGLRSGFMKLQGVQVFNADSQVWRGRADAFLAAGLAGYAVEVIGLNVFLEGAYSVRHFPSLEWTGPALPANIPRELTLSGWSVTTGIQFGIGG